MRSIQQHEWSIVLLDLTLPDRSGLDALAGVKAIRPHLPVLVLTIHPFSDLGAHCMTAGADHYCEKGNSFDGVLNLLEELSVRGTRVDG